MAAEIPATEFYEVELDESITIDWSQELWIGYNIDTPAGFPAGCDGGPAVTGYGDLISLGGDFHIYECCLWLELQLDD